MSQQTLERPTFASSDRVLARTVVRPFQRFIHREASGGIVLIVATVIALVWANSGWSSAYKDLWHAHVSIGAGSWHLDMTLHHFVNDALMAVFFFVVGLEIKREIVVGELRTLRAAGLPAMGAIGGMVVPALAFVVLNPTATPPPAGVSDGHRYRVRSRCRRPAGFAGVARLKLFLLTLAIVDDIGAVAVIAIFYSDGLSYGWLGMAVAGIVLVNLMKRAQVWDLTPYVVVGIFVWYATYKSGVHATIAGVVLGLSTPAKPLLNKINQHVGLALEDDADAAAVRCAVWHVSETASVAERLQNLLHPYTSFLIVPLFALANAGLVLSGEAMSEAATSTVTWGVALGLVVGKPVGITLFVWAAVKLLGWELPKGIRWPEFVGMGFAAGIGFTVSLFVAQLAWTAPGTEALADQAKIGVLIASGVAAIMAAVVLYIFADASDEEPLPGERPILGRSEAEVAAESAAFEAAGGAAGESWQNTSGDAKVADVVRDVTS